MNVSYTKIKRINGHTCKLTYENNRTTKLWVLICLEIDGRTLIIPPSNHSEMLEAMEITEQEQFKDTKGNIIITDSNLRNYFRTKRIQS